MKLPHFLPLLLLPVLLLAQAPQGTPPPSSPPPSNAPVWRCTLPGGIYEVALRSMTAVSSHEYLIDGGARVTEVNIATNGSLLARFYFIEANTSVAPGPAAAAMDKGQALLSEALARTGSDAWKKVVKSYPTSTHAHTAEYRLESKASLQKLFDSAAQAFHTQRPGAFTGQ